MITDSEITHIGHIAKTHGIKGEMTLVVDTDVDLTALSCLILDIDGINVPFFVNSLRPRSAEAMLIGIDGVNNENEAEELVGKDVYALNSELPLNQTDEDYDAEGFYVSDFIGYTIVDATLGTTIGSITDYDDSTANILFIVDTPSGNTIYIPVADEYIAGINTESKTLVMDIPQGLTEMQ